MTNNRSSASPQALTAYAKAAGDINTKLGAEARALWTALSTFGASCTEFRFGVGPALAQPFQVYVQQASPVDAWVAQVARWFLAADKGTGADRAAALAQLNKLLGAGPPSWPWTPSVQRQAPPLLTPGQWNQLRETLAPEEYRRLRELVGRYQTLQQQGRVSDSQTAALRRELGNVLQQAAAARAGGGTAATVAAGAGVVSAGLLADDATVVGVADDPLLLLTGAVAAGAGLWAWHEREQLAQSAQAAASAVANRLGNLVHAEESDDSDRTWPKEWEQGWEQPEIPEAPAGSLQHKTGKWWKKRGLDPHTEKGEWGARDEEDFYIDDNDFVWLKRKGSPDSTAEPIGPLDSFGGE
jgi:hypothetical protein